MNYIKLAICMAFNRYWVEEYFKFLNISLNFWVFCVFQGTSVPSYNQWDYTLWTDLRGTLSVCASSLPYRKRIFRNWHFYLNSSNYGLGAGAKITRICHYNLTQVQITDSYFSHLFKREKEAKLQTCGIIIISQFK